MKTVSTLILMLGIASAWSSVCDEKYSIDRLVNYTLTGDKPGNLSLQETRILYSYQLAALPSLNEGTEYKFVNNFESNCEGFVKKPIYFKKRPKASQNFVIDTTSDLYVSFFSDGILNGKNYSAFIGWFDEPSLTEGTMNSVVVRDTPTGPFYLWYGTAIKLDSTKNSNGQWTLPSVHYFPVISSAQDSANLQTSILKKWAEETYNDTHKAKFTVQIFRLEFVPESSVHNQKQIQRAITTNFSAQQRGSQVFIQTLNPDRPLHLFDMLGNRITVLQASNTGYRWDGTDRMGRQASGGIYFAQRDGQVLGKFLYRPN